MILPVRNLWWKNITTPVIWDPSLASSVSCHCPGINFRSTLTTAGLRLASAWIAVRMWLSRNGARTSRVGSASLWWSWKRERHSESSRNSRRNSKRSMKQILRIKREETEFNKKRNYCVSSLEKTRKTNNNPNRLFLSTTNLLLLVRDPSHLH